MVKILETLLGEPLNYPSLAPKSTTTGAQVGGFHGVTLLRGAARTWYHLQMHTLHHSIIIAAPRERVHEIMLQSPTYEQWTSVFDPTSCFEGDWSEGSTMKFLSNDETSHEVRGMVATIAKHRPAEFVSIAHHGMITGDQVISWPEGGLENYTYTTVPEGTRVDVEMTNVPEEYLEMFNEQWPRALLRLKEIIEAGQ